MDSAVNLVQVVRHGGFLPATAGNPRPYGMPPFGHVLDDADIAAVLTYVRGSWGNDAAPVTRAAEATTAPQSERGAAPSAQLTRREAASAPLRRVARRASQPGPIGALSVSAAVRLARDRPGDMPQRAATPG